MQKLLNTHMITLLSPEIKQHSCFQRNQAQFSRQTF